jgi:hypothetical protein
MSGFFASGGLSGFSLTSWIRPVTSGDEEMPNHFPQVSGVQKSFLRRETSLLSTLPPKDTWLKRGVVERRTVHANVIWRERQMILTNEKIYFARPDSDLVVDKISIRDIVSVGRVDNLDRKGYDPKHHSGEETGKHGLAVTGRPILKSPKEPGHKKMSVVESLESFQDCLRETFAFEIKALIGSSYRSYFVRVTAIHECEDWIADMNALLKSTMREQARQGTWLQMKQQDAHNLYKSFFMRCVISIAILCDFLSSVFEAEFFGQNEYAAKLAFKAVDITLCAFFSLELSLNAFGNWRTVCGMPFIRSVSNWFLLATVLFQLSGFLAPELDAKHFKVIRIIRIFDVGSAFESLRSCKMVLKALRQGSGSYLFLLF